VPILIGDEPILDGAVDQAATKNLDWGGMMASFQYTNRRLSWQRSEDKW